MALITRFSRLFRADLHAVLDRLEEPDVLLRQAIREMEEALAQRTRGQQARLHERKQVDARLAELAASAKAQAGELDLCFQAGEETLARTLLRRQLESQRLSLHLQQVRVRLDEVIGSEGAALEDGRRRLEALRQKAQMLDLEPAAKGGRIGGAAADMVVTDEDVEVAWLREQQKRRPS